MPEITLPSSTKTQQSPSSTKKKAKNNKNAPNNGNDPQQVNNEDRDSFNKKTYKEPEEQPFEQSELRDDQKVNRKDEETPLNQDFQNKELSDLDSVTNNLPSGKERRVNNARFRSRSSRSIDDQRGSRARPVNDPWADPWGDDPWSMDDGVGGATPAKASKMTPQERVSMIEEVYQHVLGRKPDTRDINYYKYSTLTAEEIKSQLLEGKEHSQLLEEGREYKKMKERAEQAEIRVKTLEGQIKDQLEEFKQLTNLLKEKNNLIQQLRANLNNPYGFSQSSNQRIDEYSRQNREHYSIGVEDQHSDINTEINNGNPQFVQTVNESRQEQSTEISDQRQPSENNHQYSSVSPQAERVSEVPNSTPNGPYSENSNESIEGNRSFSYDNSSFIEQKDLILGSSDNIGGINAALPPESPEPVQTSVEVDSPQIQSIDDALDTLNVVSEETAHTAQEAISRFKNDVQTDYQQVENKFKERKIIPPGVSDQPVPPTTVGTPHSVDNTHGVKNLETESDIGSVIFSSSLPPKTETVQKEDSKSGIKERIRGALSL